jgi:iron complex outermembrane receptor protein
VYAELMVPITKDLEMQLAVRRDHYSVIGATTNPKVAFRYQPTSWLLFRGSANKGFLAPSFTQLYSAAVAGTAERRHRSRSAARRTPATRAIARSSA